MTILVEARSTVDPFLNLKNLLVNAPRQILGGGSLNLVGGLGGGTGLSSVISHYDVDANGGSTNGGIQQRFNFNVTFQNGVQQFGFAFDWHYAGPDSNDQYVIDFSGWVAFGSNGFVDRLVHVSRLGSESGYVRNGNNIDVYVDANSNVGYSITGIHIPVADFAGALDAYKNNGDISAFDNLIFDQPVHFVGAGFNYFTGGPGGDYIDTSAGLSSSNSGDPAKGSQLYGGAGDDTIISGPGDGRAFGEAGNDTIYLSAGADALYGGTGTDTLAFLTGTTMDFQNGIFSGDAVGDTAWDSFEIIRGSSDDDVIANVLNSSSVATFHGGGGSDFLGGGAGADDLNGGDGNDSLYGNGGDDHLTPGIGNNSVQGGAGEDTLDLSDLVVISGWTIDFVSNTASGANLDPAGGGYILDVPVPAFVEETNSLLSIEAAIGTAASDTFIGSGSNTFKGGGGDDTFKATKSLFLDTDSNMSGDDGFDALFLQDGNVGIDDLIELTNAKTQSTAVFMAGGFVIGTSTNTVNYSGIEAIHAGDGNDTFDDGPDPFINFRTNVTFLYGDAGNDTFNITDDYSRVTRTFDGGTGDNKADFTGFSFSTRSGIDIDMNRAGAEMLYLSDDQSIYSNVLTNIQNLVGTYFADSMTASRTTLELHGGSGNDTLNAQAGGRSAQGGQTYDGGADIDSVSFSGFGRLSGALFDTSFTGLNIDMTRTGTEVKWTPLAGNLTAPTSNSLVSIEIVTGSNFSDFMVASASTRELHGGGGNDGLFTAGGNQLLDGGAGTADGAIFSGNRADYEITFDATTNAYTVAGIAGTAGAADGTDTVTNVEIFAFADGDISASALINRAPDVAAIDLGTSLEDTARVINASELLVGSTDPDSDPLSVANVALVDASLGTLTDLGNGTWRFTPTLNLSGQPVTFSFDVLDGAGGHSVANTASLLITPVNDDAIIAGATTGSVTEAGGILNSSVGTPVATGILTDTDVDNASNTFIAVTAATASTNGFGTFTMTADGEWTYTLDNNNPQVQALNVGQTRTDYFTVKTIDGTAQVISITINGSNDANEIVGQPNQRTLSGTSGADHFTVGVGNRTVNAGSGNDIITITPASAAQSHQIYGGNGSDTIDMSLFAQSVRIDLGEGKVSPLGSGKEFAELASIENANGGSGNDVMIGNRASNRLDGYAGNDRISAGAGNDLLVGGSGNDLMTGGIGNNSFVFIANFGRDTITDFHFNSTINRFSQLGHDTLDFSGLSIRFTDFADLIAHTTSTGINDTTGNAVIHAKLADDSMSSDDTITLTGVTVAQLTSLYAAAHQLDFIL